MNKTNMKNRVKFCPAYEKKILEAKPSSVSRRDPNFIDMSDFKTDNIISDFFEFEKELSELKPSNKTSDSDSNK
jgi:hypothetical protein